MAVLLSKVSRTIMGWLRRVNLFPFLLPVFFLLHVARYFDSTIPALSVMKVLGIYLVGVAALYALLSRLIRKKMARGIAAAMLVALFIYWMPIIQAIGTALHIDGNYNYYPVIVAIYFLVIAIICRLIHRLSAKASAGLRYYMNALFSVFILVEAGFIGYYALAGLHEKPLTVMNDGERAIDFSAKAGNNIYLLLFDEYASTASLREDWGYDNHATDSFLKARGFFINARSRSNYCWTIFSMSSLLNMDYLNNYRQQANYYKPREAQEYITSIKNARAADVLRGAGYDIKSYSIFDFADQPGQPVPELIIRKGALLLHNSFYEALVNSYLPYLASRQAIKKNPDYRYPAFYRMDDYNNQGVDAVLREARQGVSKPKFVYAHFMMPHNRYYYDSAGRLMSMEAIKAITADQDLEYYRYSVRHTNEKMRQMVSAIQSSDSEATIVVLGDHGYRLKIDEHAHPEYFRNLSAIYFPDRNYASLPDSFSNVNVLRIVLNKVCGTNYPLLADKQYTLIYSND